MSGIEDVVRKLSKLEDILRCILIKLEKLEELTRHLNPNINYLVRVASEMIVLFSIPPALALKAASRMLSIISRYGVLDDISKAIIEVLCVEDGISISELTRRVKEIRGRASRRIISGRLRILASSGIVVLERRGSRVLVKLNI